MSTTNRLFNDVVFENRNKSYGAYELRLKYVDRMARAVFTTMGIICIVAVLTFFLKESASPALVKTIEGQVEKFIEVVIPHSDQSVPKEPELKIEQKRTILVAHTDVAPEVKNDVLDNKPAAPSETNSNMNGTDGADKPSENNNGATDPTSTTGPGLSSNDTDSVVIDPGVYPQFPGGSEALSRFLANHIIYPEDAKANRIAGTVYVSFIIDKEGKVSEVKPLRELPYGCTEAALNAVNQMPNWIPGKNNGKPVKVKYTIPLKFSLR